MRYASLIESSFEIVGRSGEEYTCRCPWCQNDKPVLYANAVKGLYVCFTCHQKGRLDDLGDLPMQTTDGLRDRLTRMKQPAQEQHYYPEAWLRQFDVPHPYWTQERNLDPQTVATFGLGYDPFSNRVTLPLRDVQGRILGVTFRRLDDGRPKYLHPKGFPVGRHLYGAWLLGSARTVALVEGQVDAIRCVSERVPAVSLMGSRITKDQIKVLQRLGVEKVVLMLDNDSAGQHGTLAIHEALQGHGMRVVAGWYRPYWAGVKDPDGLRGDRLRKMFHSAVPLPQWAARVSAY